MLPQFVVLCFLMVDSSPLCCLLMVSFHLITFCSIKGQLGTSHLELFPPLSFAQKWISMTLKGLYLHLNQGGWRHTRLGRHKCGLKMKRSQSKDLQVNLAGKVLTSGACSVYFQSDKVAMCIYVTAAVYTFDWTQPCELIAPVYNSHSTWWSGEAKGPLHWMRVAFKQLWKLQPFCSDSS